MVALTSGRLRWTLAAASARQPAAVSCKLTGNLSGLNSGVRASISTRWPIFDLIATHLQLHLAITKMIPTLDLVKH
jgi:hypothetical protein